MLKQIPDYADYYASKDGRIFSNKYHPTRNKKCELRELKPIRCKRRGYFLVNLYQNGKKKTRLVHQLILETFVGPRPFGFDACHGPNGLEDNSLENLYWASKSTNHGIDKVRDGTDNRGEKNHRAKLSELQVRVIRAFKQLKNSPIQKEIGEFFGVARNTVSQVQNNYIWKHLDMTKPELLRKAA